MKKFAKLKLFSVLEKTKTDGLLTMGPWFTQGHIETAGDDSIAVVPFGQKLWLISVGSAVMSKTLEKTFTSAKTFMAVLSWRPTKAQASSWRLWHPAGPRECLIQPSLAALTVLTNAAPGNIKIDNDFCCAI
jgi:hypothetical protein